MDKLEEMEQSKASPKGITPWDVAIAVLGKDRDIGIMTLKADMAIIKKVAEGFSAHSIGLMLGVPTGNILKISAIWGLSPMVGTLDFSPLFVYKDGMTPDELMDSINVVLSIPLARRTAETAIRNIERYYELLEFIEEEDRKGER